jgi:hypothetical protein
MLVVIIPKCEFCGAELQEEGFCYCEQGLAKLDEEEESLDVLLAEQDYDLYCRYGNKGEY